MDVSFQLIWVNMKAGDLGSYGHFAFFAAMNMSSCPFSSLPAFDVVSVPDLGHSKRGDAFISHASKVMLKILQARLQQYVNHELPDVQAGFRKGRGTRDQIANTLDCQKSKRVPEKHLLLLY